MWKKKLRQPQYSFNSEKVFLVATQPGKSVYSYLQTTRLGLTKGEVEQRQSTYGKNEVVHEQRKNPFILFIKTFINPFIGVLTELAVVSLILDVLMASPGEQEWRANEATDSLMKMVKNTCLVKRAGAQEEELDITHNDINSDRLYESDYRFRLPSLFGEQENSLKVVTKAKNLGKKIYEKVSFNGEEISHDNGNTFDIAISKM